MSRYIDADALIAQYKGDVLTAQVDYAEGVRDVIEDVKNAPSIDIVRCRECRYFIDNLTEDDTDEAYGECCFDWDIKMPTAEDFCSRGEREGE